MGWLRAERRRTVASISDRWNKPLRHGRKTLCPRCGYDVAGMPDVPCSECSLLIQSNWREGCLGAGAPARVRLYRVGLVYSTIFCLVAAIMLPAVLSFPLALAVLQTAVILFSAFLVLAGLKWKSRLLYGERRLLVVYLAASGAVTMFLFVESMTLQFWLD